MSRIFIGVDNGLDGGIVILNSEGVFIEKICIPTVCDGKKRRLDAIVFNQVLSSYLCYECSVTVERPAGSKNVNAAVSMADSFAKIETVLALSKVRRSFITALTWQREFWTVPKMAKGEKFDTKAAALLAAGRLWPKESWLASSRCRVAHDGMVDAALIAEFARRRGL